MGEHDRNEVMVSARDLVVGYGSFMVQRDLTFDVHRGDIFAILGATGCGKSTLLRTLVGLQPPMGGTVHIAGVGTPDLTIDGAPHYAVMFQSGALFGSMTLLENVALPLSKWGQLPEEAVEAVALARLRLVGLGGFENFLPAEVSGGMKKRAGIARALALDPSLLFLDEPSAGLDPVTAVALDELMLTLADELGVTIVLVSHELDSIFKVARPCILMDKVQKGIIARGDPKELRDHSEDPRVLDFLHRRSAKRRTQDRA